MQLPSDQFQELHDAVRDAYTANRLEQMLYTRLGKRLDEISLDTDFKTVVFKLLRDAEMNGYVPALIVAARQSNPGNEKLQAVAQRFGLSALTSALEKIVRADLSFLDIALWRRKLGEVENRICKVEAGRVSGTGFLVGPGTLMTNYHVMKGVIEGKTKPADIAFRFDYKRTEDGTTVNPGTVFKLPATDWLIDSSPYSDVDLLRDPGSQLPAPDHLDYALVRVDGAPGDLPVAHLKAEQNAPSRGFIKAPSSAVTFENDAPVFIVQHPEGDPLSLALETKGIEGVNANKTRVRYRTNTLGGSSGSPCFDANWNLVALHHSGDPKADPPDLARYNQGIPIDAIVALLTKRGRAGELG
jgi:hypothetical protein